MLEEVQNEAIKVDNHLFKAHVEECCQNPHPQPPCHPQQQQQYQAPCPNNFPQHVQQQHQQQGTPFPHQPQQQQPPQPQQQPQAGLCLRCGLGGHYTRDCNATPVRVNIGLRDPQQDIPANYAQVMADIARDDVVADRAFEGVQAQEGGWGNNQEGQSQGQGNDRD
ncbi:hypothetical protein FRB94_006656 [Tulasnella sp. JGI-2019a]|nr:hypothetical protein FRB94_006656 [Tulasnella sp. JGI-2019a]